MIQFEIEDLMKIGITRKLGAAPSQHMHLMAAAAQRGHYIFGKEFIAPTA